MSDWRDSEIYRAVINHLARHGGLKPEPVPEPMPEQEPMPEPEPEPVPEPVPAQTLTQEVEALSAEQAGPTEAFFRKLNKRFPESRIGLINVAGDGNCFYRAVARALGRDEDASIRKWRKAIARDLRSKEFDKEHFRRTIRPNLDLGDQITQFYEGDIESMRNAYADITETGSVKPPFPAFAHYADQYHVIKVSRITKVGVMIIRLQENGDTVVYAESMYDETGTLFPSFVILFLSGDGAAGHYQTVFVQTSKGKGRRPKLANVLRVAGDAATKIVTKFKTQPKLRGPRVVKHLFANAVGKPDSDTAAVVQIDPKSSDESAPDEDGFGEGVQVQDEDGFGEGVQVQDDDDSSRDDLLSSLEAGLKRLRLPRPVVSLYLENLRTAKTSSAGDVRFGRNGANYALFRTLGPVVIPQLWVGTDRRRSILAESIRPFLGYDPLPRDLNDEEERIFRELFVETEDGAQPKYRIYITPRSFVSVSRLWASEAEAKVLARHIYAISGSRDEQEKLVTDSLRFARSINLLQAVHSRLRSKGLVPRASRIPPASAEDYLQYSGRYGMYLAFRDQALRTFREATLEAVYLDFRQTPPKPLVGEIVATVVDQAVAIGANLPVEDVVRNEHRRIMESLIAAHRVMKKGRSGAASTRGEEEEPVVLDPEAAQAAADILSSYRRRPRGRKPKPAPTRDPDLDDVDIAASAEAADISDLFQKKVAGPGRGRQRPFTEQQPRRVVTLPRSDPEDSDDDFVKPPPSNFRRNPSS
jgi:hypothetical protein